MRVGSVAIAIARYGHQLEGGRAWSKRRSEMFLDEWVCVVKPREADYGVFACGEAPPLRDFLREADQEVGSRNSLAKEELEKTKQVSSSKWP